MRTTSKKLVALQRRAYEVGAISFKELVTAQRQLLELELKLAKAPADRIKVLSEQLKLAEDAEKLSVKQRGNLTNRWTGAADSLGFK